MKNEIIVTTKIYAPTQARLDQEFTCHRLHEAPDRAAFLKQHAPKVRALATFGPAGADAALMDALPKLEIISNFGVGVDAIDLDAAKQRKIIVTNTPDVLNDCVADTAMALTVNVMRRFPQAEGYLRAGSWRAKGAYPLTTSLGGKIMGILGLGRIGEAIAKRAQAFGMKIRYHNRRKKDVAYPYDGDAVALAKNSDVLMIVTPGGPETEKLVNAKVLDALGPEGYLVNIARGSVVDEPVLLRYLQERKIAGAGLDVFADEPRVPPEFFRLENAVLLPHVGSATVETRTAMGNLQVDNLVAHFAGKPVLTRVV
jgi:lactate dehydrogenase-like 2-hydroxyacid dehydrogenase